MAFTITPIGTQRTRGSGSPSALGVTLNDFETMLEDDLTDVFFTQDDPEFARVAVYEHYDGPTENYSIIYDDPTKEVDVQISAGTFNKVPQFMIQETIIKKPLDKRDRVTYKGVKYFINRFENDGVGVVTVFLRLK